MDYSEAKALFSTPGNYPPGVWVEASRTILADPQSDEDRDMALKFEAAFLAIPPPEPEFFWLAMSQFVNSLDREPRIHFLLGVGCMVFLEYATNEFFLPEVMPSGFTVPMNHEEFM